MMRVVYNVALDGLDSINTAASQLQSAVQQVSTGRRINAPSDDPIGTQQAIGQQAAIGAIDSYTSVGDSASARLSAADNVLTNVVSSLTQAIVTGTSAQGSTTTPAAQSAASASIRSLRDQIASDLNTAFQGTYLFAGTNVTQAAYAQVGGVWTYQGNSATTEVEVQQGQSVSTTFNGQAIAQGSDSTDVLTTLDNLASAIDTNDQAGIANGLAALDRAFDRANQAQGGLGASENTVTNAQSQLSTLRTAAQTRDSQLEDANMAQAVTRLTNAQNAYQGALGAVTGAERNSLLDYLTTSSVL
jgi:flagellar hook-associated protein 3 FlgL